MANRTLSEYLNIMNGKRQGSNAYSSQYSINDVGSTDYDASFLSILGEQTKASVESAQQTSKGREKSIIERTINTADAIALNVAEGLFNFFDDIADFGADALKFFGAITEEQRDQFTDYDWQSYAVRGIQNFGSVSGYISLMSGEAPTTWDEQSNRDFLNSINEGSWASEWGGAGQFIRGAEQSIGYMLPSIVAGLLSGGFATAAGATTQGISTAQKIGSLATMGLGAFSGQAHETYKSTDDMLKALAAGSLSAAIEVGTEFLGETKGMSRILGVFGKTDNLIKNMAGEALEEMISGAFQPVIDSLAEGNSAFEKYGDLNFWFGLDQDSVLMQGLSGAFVGGILGSPAIINDKLGKNSNKVLEKANEVRDNYNSFKETVVTFGEGSEAALGSATKFAESLNEYKNALVEWGSNASEEQISKMADVMKGDEGAIESLNLPSEITKIDQTQTQGEQPLSTIKEEPIKAETIGQEQGEASEERTLVDAGDKMVEIKNYNDADNAFKGKIDSLTESLSFGDDRFKVVEKDGYNERLSTLKLAIEADEKTAKEYLRKYFEHYEIEYENAQGHKETHNLREYLTSEESQSFEQAVNDIYDALKAENPNKYDKKIERIERKLAKSEQLSSEQKAEYERRLKELRDSKNKAFQEAKEKWSKSLNNMQEKAKEALNKAKQVRPLTRELTNIKSEYSIREIDKTENPEAYRGNLRWGFTHYLEGSGGSYKVSQEFFDAIEKYGDMIANDETGEMAYLEGEAYYIELALANELRGIVEEVEGGKPIYHQLTSEQLKMVRKAIKDIKGKIASKQSISYENKAIGKATTIGFQDTLGKRGKLSSGIGMAVAGFSNEVLRPDVTFELVFGSNNYVNEVLGDELNKGFNDYGMEYIKNFENPRDEAFKSNKPNLKEYRKGYVTYKGSQVPMMTIANIYAASLTTDVEYDHGKTVIVDGNNLKCLKEKGISYEGDDGKIHDIAPMSESDIAEAIELLPKELKEYIKWHTDFLNSQAKADYEKIAKMIGADTTNALQGYYVPKKADIGKANYGNPIVRGALNKNFTKSRTGSVNKLVTFDLLGAIESNYQTTLIMEYIEPINQKIKSIFSSEIDYDGDKLTLRQVFEREKGSKFVRLMDDAIDNKVRSVMGISKNMSNGTWVEKAYDFVRQNVGANALALSPSGMLKQPLSNFAIPGWSNVELIARTPQILSIINDKAMWNEIQNHNKDTIYGVAIRGKTSQVTKAMLNSDDAVHSLSRYLMGGYRVMDNLAMAYGVGYIHAKIQAEYPNLKFGTSEYWAKADQMTSDFYAHSVNHLAPNKGKLFNSKHPVAQTFAMFQMPNALLMSGVVESGIRSESYYRLKSAEALREILKEKMSSQSKAETKAKDLKVELDIIEAEVVEEVDSNGNQKPKKQIQDEIKAHQDKVKKARESYQEARSELAEAKGEAMQAKKNLDFKESYKPINNIAHSISTLLVVGTASVAVTELVKRLLGKKEWDDWLSDSDANKIPDEIDSLIQQTTYGYIPIINTITNWFTKNYDVEMLGTSLVQDFVDDVKSLFDNSDGVWTTKKISSLADAVGKFLGIPFKNAYNIAYGFIKMIDPSMAIGMQDFFYGVSQSKLTQTIKEYEKRNDISTASKLIQRSYALYKSGEVDHDTAVELAKLQKEGYDPMAKNVPDYYANDKGDRVEMSDEEMRSFYQEYSKANAQIAKTIKSSSYLSLGNEKRAKLLKKIYNAYYDMAKYKALGGKYEPSSKIGKILAYANGDIDIAQTLLLAEKAQELVETKSKTKKEQTIALVNKSSLDKNGKLLALVVMGYGISGSSKEQLTRYLVRKGFTKKQAEDLL